MTAADGAERTDAAAPPPTRAADHEHVDCAPAERAWLESHVDQAATMRPHLYCVGCGRVKALGGPRARRLGFYLSGLAALKGYLEGSPAHRKMTQSESRLIAKGLEALPDFEDPYGLSREVQARLYLEAVRRTRPDLDGELVLRLLPQTRRKEWKAWFATMPSTAG